MIIFELVDTQTSKSLHRKPPTGFTFVSIELVQDIVQVKMQ